MPVTFERIKLTRKVPAVSVNEIEKSLGFDKIEPNYDLINRLPNKYKEITDSIRKA